MAGKQKFFKGDSVRLKCSDDSVGASETGKVVFVIPPGYGDSKKWRYNVLWDHAKHFAKDDLKYGIDITTHDGTDITTLVQI